MWPMIAAAIIVGTAALIALPFVLSRLFFRLYGKMNGLYRMGAAFPAPGEPSGRVHKGQTVGVGQVLYRRDADVAFSGEGLYLWVRPFLGKYPPALIPWSEVHGPKPAILALRQAVRISVGRPEIASIVLMQPLFDEARPHLTTR